MDKITRELWKFCNKYDIKPEFCDDGSISIKLPSNSVEDPKDNLRLKPRFETKSRINDGYSKIIKLVSSSPLTLVLIEKSSGLSEKTVKKNVSKLVEFGILKQSGGAYSINLSFLRQNLDLLKSIKKMSYSGLSKKRDGVRKGGVFVFPNDAASKVLSEMGYKNSATNRRAIIACVKALSFRHLPQTKNITNIPHPTSITN